MWLNDFNGGQGEIRTHGTPKRTLDFESSAFDHSATCPVRQQFNLKTTIAVLVDIVGAHQVDDLAPIKQVRYSNKEIIKIIMALLPLHRHRSLIRRTCKFWLLAAPGIQPEPDARASQHRNAAADAIEIPLNGRRCLVLITIFETGESPFHRSAAPDITNSMRPRFLLAKETGRTGCLRRWPGHRLSAM